MSSERGLVGDTVVNIVAIGLSIAGAIAYQSILAWQLGPSGRGEYGFMLAIATVMAVVFTLGTDRAIQIRMISKSISVQQAVTTASLVGLLGSLAAMVVLAWLFDANWELLAKVAPENRGLILLLVPAVALPLAIQLLLAGQRHFVELAVFNLLRAILQIGLAACLFLVLSWDTKAAYATYVLSSGFILFGYFSVLWIRHGGAPAVVSREEFRGILDYSLRYLPARLGNVINSNLALLLLGCFATFGEVGLFSLAASLTGQALVISVALDRSIQPRIGTDGEGVSGLIAQCCRVSTLMFGLMLGTLLVAAHVLVPVVFSPSFRDSIPLLSILAVGVWIKGATKPLRTYFVGSNRPGLVSVSMTVELASTALFLALLYPFTGITGAAVGTVLGQLTGSVVLVVAYRSATNSSYRDLFVWNAHDTKCLKDHLIVALRLRLKHRQFHSSAAASSCSRDHVPRQVIVASDRIIKKQPSDSCRMEVERTRALARIGEQTGLFRVPEILHFDAGDGVIEFVKITGIRPLSEVLLTQCEGRRLVARVGRSIAVINRHLEIVEQDKTFLPDAWNPFQDSSIVGIHGDFSAYNTFYSADSDELIVLDCATSDRCGGSATVGPWYFDLAWFSQSLFASSIPCGKKHSELAELILLLLTAYCDELPAIRNHDDFVRYLDFLIGERVAQVPSRTKLLFFRQLKGQIPQRVRQEFIDELRARLIQETHDPISLSIPMEMASEVGSQSKHESVVQVELKETVSQAAVRLRRSA